MEESKERLVMPGEEVGTHEEWMPGEGTYEANGIIYAKTFGRLEYDEEKLEATVKAFNPVTEVKEGDIIYGTIRERRKAIATADIALVEGSSRGIAMDMEATLHISKISDDYTENIEDKYLKGDVIRAKVTQTTPSIQITTMDKDLGVVRGYCFKCRRGMERTGDTLFCGYCDRRESRKISNLYGRITLKSK